MVRKRYYLAIKIIVWETVPFVVIWIPLVRNSKQKEAMTLFAFSLLTKQDMGSYRSTTYTVKSSQLLYEQVLQSSTTVNSQWLCYSSTSFVTLALLLFNSKSVTQYLCVQAHNWIFLIVCIVFAITNNYFNIHTTLLFHRFLEFSQHCYYIKHSSSNQL